MHEGVICTKNDLRAGVDSRITDAEVYIIKRIVLVRDVQGRCRELACVFRVIDPAKFDTTLAVRT